MRHDTHAWSWAICLSFTTALSWVVPFECLGGSTAAAAPVPIPIAAEDDGRDRPPPKLVRYVPRAVGEFARAAWHPVMDLLGVKRTNDFTSMGELVLDYEIEGDDPLHHGWWIEGTWGEVPIYAEILEWKDFTQEAQSYFNGMGATPDEDMAVLIEEDVQVVETAVIVHNQMTGERLGMMLELAWFEASDDDFDGITSFPIAHPNRVIEDPGHDFLDDNPLFPDYFFWCDFLLTEEGQVRAEQRWRDGCLTPFPCALGVCPEDPDAFWYWCPFHEMYRDCGEIDLTTPLGEALNDYNDCKTACDDAWEDCMILAFGGGAVGGASTLGVLHLLQKIAMSAEGRICLASGIGIWACLAIVVGVTIVTTGVVIYQCNRRYDRCMKACTDAWKKAIQDSQNKAITEQCAPPAP